MGKMARVMICAMAAMVCNAYVMEAAVVPRRLLLQEDGAPVGTTEGEVPSEAMEAVDYEGAPETEYDEGVALIGEIAQGDYEGGADVGDAAEDYITTAYESTVVIVGIDPSIAGPDGK